MRVRASRCRVRACRATPTTTALFVARIAVRRRLPPSRPMPYASRAHRRPHDAVGRLDEEGTMGKALTILALTMLCGCAAMAHGRKDAAQVDEARQAIAAGNAQFERAVTAGDAAAIARLYTTDAILLPDGGEMESGDRGGV